MRDLRAALAVGYFVRLPACNSNFSNFSSLFSLESATVACPLLSEATLFCGASLHQCLLTNSCGTKYK